MLDLSPLMNKSPKKPLCEVCNLTASGCCAKLLQVEAALATEQQLTTQQKIELTSLAEIVLGLEGRLDKSEKQRLQTTRELDKLKVTHSKCEKEKVCSYPLVWCS